MEHAGVAPRFELGPRFDVRRRLGAGGMGVVFEAYDHDRQELVALKTLRRHDAHWLARFKREFRSVHELAHPNLVAIHELFDTAAEPFFTMELVRGVDFLAWVRDGRRRNPRPSVDPLQDTAASIMGSIEPAVRPPHEKAGDGIVAPVRGLDAIACDERRLRSALEQLVNAVAALHAAGKIHRDIKPSNILVTADGRLVLLDFGLLYDATSGAASDQRGAGTAAYMAPEQAFDGSITPAADWYSVGVVLFQALTGTLPHTGQTRYELMIRKQSHPAQAPRQLVPSVPSDLDALCTDLLRREPLERPASQEILDRLARPDVEARADSIPTSASIGTPQRLFVGREAELAELRNAYDRASTGPLIYLVEGESGLGKSSLVEHFLETLSDDEPDAVILSGRCYEREMVAYKAFDGLVDALARYLRNLPSVEVAEVMPRRAELLGRLFPVLKRVDAIAMAPVVRDLPEPQGQRRRMFAALRELFLRIATRHRLVWFVDDLQWTDVDSLVLLQELLAHEHALPVLLIATTRVIDDAAHKGLLARLQDLAPLESRRLAELRPEETRELAAALMPGRDHATLDAAAAEAEGHPLFLHELARHIDTSGLDGMTGVGFEQMLTFRIDQLDASTRRLLDVICVSGGPLIQEVAGLAAELTHAEQIRSARVLGAANLARTNGVRKTDEIVTYHDRVREHIIARLDGPTLQHIHMRLALALEKTGAAEHAPRTLARHAQAAGRHELAARYAHAAAKHAVSSLAFDQAAELYDIAIQLGEHDADTLRALRIDRANALVNAGRGAEAAAVFSDAAHGADATTAMECRRRAAEQLLSSGHIDEGVEVVAELLGEVGASLPVTPGRALARLLWTRARLRVRGLAWKERHEREISDADLARLDVFKAVGVGLNMVDTIRGADFQARHLLLALELGEPLRIGRALAHEACYLSTQGSGGRRRANHLIAECQRIHDRTPTPYLEGWLATANALVLYMGGDFAAAQELFARAEKVFFEQTVGKTWELNTVRLFQLFTLRHLGEFGQLRTLSNMYMRDARRRGDLLTETSMRRVRNIAWLAEGRPEEARRDLERAAWQPPGGSYHLQHYYELESRIELALLDDQPAMAYEAFASDFERLSKSLLVRVQIVRTIATWLRGRLALAAAAAGHDRKANLAVATRCAAATGAEDARYGVVWSALLASGVAMQEGDEAAAIEGLSKAAAAASVRSMAQCEAAAQYRRGQLIGGDEGARLMLDAERSMRERGAVAILPCVKIVAPGFERSPSRTR